MGEGECRRQNAERAVGWRVFTTEDNEKRETIHHRDTEDTEKRGDSPERLRIFSMASLCVLCVSVVNGFRLEVECGERSFVSS
jgi:hypothetical protein